MSSDEKRSKLPSGPGAVLVVSGPSGVGKSTVVKRLLEDPKYVLSVSATTRNKRPGEENGKEYHFLDRDDFEKWIEKDKFIEHVELFGNLYGTPRAPLEKAVHEGKIFVLDIDVRGAIRLRDKGIEGIYVLLAPPDGEILEKRLRGRATEDEKQVNERINHANWELEQERYYDHVVINDDLERCVEEIKAIVEKELRV